MPLVELLLAVAVACGLWAGVSAVLIARALERQGVRTPFPFLGLFIFRNLRRYSETTRAKTGKTGPLFYSYVVPINAALILVVITVVLLLVVGWSSALAAPAPADAPQSWVEEGWAPWERELTARQQPDRVMDVIGLNPGMVVGEIGAQTGRFTVHLARRVGPAGRVFANDIDDRALAELRDRVTRYNVPNIEVVRGQVDDPRLPPNALDLAIMVRTYHELAQPRAILENLKSSLRSGAPVVIVDLDTEKTRHSDAKSSTAEASVLGVAQSAGYELVALHRFLLEDTIFVLRVAERSALVATARSLASSGGAQVPARKPDSEVGFKLLADLVLLLDKAGKGAIDTAAVNTAIVRLAKDLETARDAKRVDPLFAVRYSRLLSAVRQGLLTDPGLLYWPMYRSSMIDFIEERTGRMPDREKLLFVVNDHGGSGVGLAMLVEPVMSEIVSLHIHLETLDRRPAILKAYLEGMQKARESAR